MTKLHDFKDATMRALGFLSRIPVSPIYFSASHSTANDASAYPVAGVIIGLPAALLVALGGLATGSELVFATLALAATVILTGALHEDGLGDVADGFFASHDRDKILTIMRDPHQGTFGTLALIVSVILRISALAAIMSGAGALAAAFALLGIEAASRAAMVWHWHELPNVRKDGKAAAAGQPTERDMLQAVIIGAVLFSILAAGLGGLWLSGLVAAFVAAIVAVSFAAFCRHKIDGHTGDTIGATQQLVAAAMLAVLAISANLPT